MGSPQVKRSLSPCSAFGMLALATLIGRIIHLRTNYDPSLPLLTPHKPEDSKEGAHMDVLEDHAFFAHSDRYHKLLDSSESFIREYMDMVLNTHAANTSAWYVPTAGSILNVDTRKLL